MRYKKWLLTVGLLFLNIVPLFAQIDNPCGGSADPDDPTPTCPLDTWVIVLVIAALIFGYRHIQKQKKALIA